MTREQHVFKVLILTVGYRLNAAYIYFYFHNACFLTEARNHLRRMREDQVRDGQTVVSLWEDVLMSERNKLGDECKRMLNKEQ